MEDLTNFADAEEFLDNKTAGLPIRIIKFILLESQNTIELEFCR